MRGGRAARFRAWAFGVIAVDRAGGCVDDAALVRASGFEDVEEASAVDVECLSRLFHGERNRDERGVMQNDGGSVAGGSTEFGVPDITFDKRKALPLTIRQ